MRIFIVGLGLIGASYAEGLHHKGHQIYAYNRTQAYIDEGIKQGIIEKDNHMNQMSSCDLVLLALYPKHNVEFIKNHRHLLKVGQVISDVSGTKVWMMKEIEALIPDGVSYTSTHPMAGKETTGFINRDPNIFKQANYIIVKGSKSHPKDEKILRDIASDLKFGKIITVDAKTHDELIAYTSQLTHMMAVALMHSDHLNETKQATGDSYRDLTRIAKINETMWTELFLENKEALLSKIDDFIDEMHVLRHMLEFDEKEDMMTYLKEAKERRKSFD